MLGGLAAVQRGLGMLMRRRLARTQALLDVSQRVAGAIAADYSHRGFGSAPAAPAAAPAAPSSAPAPAARPLQAPPAAAAAADGPLPLSGSEEGINSLLETLADGLEVTDDETDEPSDDETAEAGEEEGGQDDVVL